MKRHTARIKAIRLPYFALILAGLNLILFHIPLLQYIFSHISYTSLNGIMLIASFVILLIFLNALVFYLLLYISRIVGRIVLCTIFILNSIATYFVSTYSVILDESMMGNIFNTNYSEASSFIAWKLFLYVLLLGILPSLLIARVKITTDGLKRFFSTFAITIIAAAIIGLINAPNWLWIDKNATSLGGLAMPWSYTVNSAIFFKHQRKSNRKEIPLPDATLREDGKKLLILVIGESARRANFSLYGYEKETNPHLQRTPHLFLYEVSSCATYTTAALQCMLEHEESEEHHEILPNYLERMGVDVVWRTSNSGEPPIRIEEFHNCTHLMNTYGIEGPEYDEILLCGLKERIERSDKSKILIILHTSTSHGPSYSKKYPPQFEIFTPVCRSVELGNCSREELINAYDNTIVYTDHLLHQIIETLRALPQFESSLIFLSDHGESLGEKNLYMHGVPLAIAPREQYEIPFIVWLSDTARQTKQNITVTQHHVFHSVLHFLGIESPIYSEEKNIYQ